MNTMEKGYIFVKGAKEHNLKNIDVKIPRNTMTVITGLSGSGKSSLAFDTIYAEGQRRYVESLSSYARQFLEQMQKPDVEYIEGLSPAISIEQRTASGNPRSIVGTQTEIYDYLRLLYARIGKVHCPNCGKEVTRQSSQEVVEQVLKLPQGTKILILAPLVRGKKGEYRELFKQIQKEGFIRARVDGKIIEVEAPPALHKYKKHTIEVVVDRLALDEKEDTKKRLADSIEIALRTGNGILMVLVENCHSEPEGRRILKRSFGPEPGPQDDNSVKTTELLFSELYACADCGISFEAPQPRMFSFNSPYGACPKCGGLGNRMEIDPELVVPDKSRPVIEAIEPWRRGGKGIWMYYRRLLRSLANDYNFDVNAPYKDLDAGIKKVIFYGDEAKGGWFEGVVPNLERRFKETQSEYMKMEINKYMSVLPCVECNGKRLKKESLAVTIHDKKYNGPVRIVHKGHEGIF